MAVPDHRCPDLGATATITEEGTPSANTNTFSIPKMNHSDHQSPHLDASATPIEESIQHANIEPLSIPGLGSSNLTGTSLPSSIPVCTDIAQLQAALAEERQRSAKIEAKLAALEASEQDNNICLFLQVLPRETRDHIYSFVLVSENLSDKSSVYVASPDPSVFPAEPAQQDFPTIKYGLSPALLRTCRQIYEEASAVLYGNNIFYIDCGSIYRASSPIFRRENRPLQLASDMVYPYDIHPPPGLIYSTAHDEIKSFAAVTKVRRWKVFVSSHKPLRHFKCPPAGLACLCRAVCHSDLLTLDILLVPTGRMYFEEYTWNVVGRRPSLPIEYNRLSLVLQPLQLLRNVQFLALRPAPVDECRSYETSARIRHPGVAPTPAVPEPNPEPIQIPTQLAAKICSVIQGNSPVIRIFEMFDNLVAYAQAFERNDVYKAEMRPKYGWCEEPSRMPYYDRPERSFFKRARNYRSPDIYTEIHPVENRLEQASIAADRNDLVEFKKHRKAVIKHLEQHYAPISSAAAVLAEMIKLEKRHGGLFGVTKLRCPSPEVTYELPRKMACFVVALHKYAKSFERDLTHDMEVDIQLRAREWKHAYSMLPREQLLRKLDSLIESGSTPSNFPSVPEFVATFKLAMDDMDKQYLEIRQFRKLLFKDDPDGVAPRWYGDDFFQPWLCDEMVNWAVNEPDMSPAPDPDIPILSPQEVRRRLRAARFPHLTTPTTAQPTAANAGATTAINAEANANVSGEQDDDVDSIWGDLNDLSEDQQPTNTSPAPLSDVSES